MSDDIEHEATRNPSAGPQEQRSPAEKAGFQRGSSWYFESTNLLQLDRLQRAIRQESDLAHCADMDQAIFEFVRIIEPTRATSLASARSYWEEVRGQDNPSTDCLPFIIGFLRGALDAAGERRIWIAVKAIADWISNLTSGQLVQVSRFVDEYASSWMNGDLVYPNGCDGPAQLVYYMAHGRLPHLEPRELNQYVRAWFVDHLETESIVCFFDSFIEEFIFYVAVTLPDDYEEQINAAYVAIAADPIDSPWAPPSRPPRTAQGEEQDPLDVSPLGDQKGQESEVPHRASSEIRPPRSQ